MNLLSKWLKARNSREVFLLLIAFAVCMTAFVSFSRIESLRYRDNAYQRLREMQKASAVLPDIERALQERKPQVHVSIVTPEELQRLALDMGLSLHLSKHQSTIQLEQSVMVSFPLLLQWLQLIERRWGVQTKSLKLVREKQHVRLIKMELVNVS